MTVENSEPKFAATLLLLRDFESELQVFMQQRSFNASFVGGAYVFPGGKVDANDFNFSQNFLNFPDRVHEKILFQKPLAKISAIAAIRECFEEAGVLLAYDHTDTMLTLDKHLQRQDYERLRNALNANEISFEELCKTKNLRLAINELVFLGHWITPKSSVQRFDTLFFACIAPAFQEGIHDDYESINSVWWTADEALEKYRKGEIQLITPTVKSLEHLTKFKSAQDFIEHQRLGLTVLGR